MLASKLISIEELESEKLNLETTTVEEFNFNQKGQKNHKSNSHRRLFEDGEPTFYFAVAHRNKKGVYHTLEYNEEV